MDATYETGQGAFQLFRALGGRVGGMTSLASWTVGCTARDTTPDHGLRCAVPSSTTCPVDAGSPLASWRVTVNVGWLAGGTPAQRVTSSGWLKVPTGTRAPALSLTQAS